MSGVDAGAISQAGGNAWPGQAVYTDRTLKLYDWVVLRFSNRFLWRCPTAELVALYDANVSANVLEPLDFPVEPFGSLGITYLLHCLPGPLSRKAAAFANLKPVLNDGARVFGATILGRSVSHNALGRWGMRFYNRRGIFGNAEDDLEGLRAILESQFEGVEIRLCGTVALFTANHRRGR